MFCATTNLMANLDETLLARHTLASPEEEQDAAAQMREDRGQERLQTATEGGQLSGDTLEQQQRGAINAKAPVAAEEAPSAASTATSKLLELSWPNLLDPFACVLALAYINTHVFGHSVLGEKVFCALGEEWIPPQMRTGIFAKSFKDKAKTIGLLEIIGLVLLDFAALAALFVLIVVVAWIADSFLAQVGMGVVNATSDITTYLGNIFE
jgi:hypothetical protein